MPKVMKEVEVVVVGMGFAGSIIARELSGAGMQVVGLERGMMRDTVPDFQGPMMHDELRYATRLGLMQDASKETVTLRNRISDVALPVRRFASFLPGSGLGGAGTHWNGQTWRFHADEFSIRSRYAERYGAHFADAELQLQDWGISYEELEPYYDRFEYLCGIAGKAGNLRGELRDGGNRNEGMRRRDFPTPPMKETYSCHLFSEGARRAGYNSFPIPSGNMSQPYTNPDGLKLKPCMFCGYCERFGCEHYAKSSPHTVVLPTLLRQKNFELRTGAHVTQVVTDASKKQATGVRYIDGLGNEVVQPARLVIITAFSFHNVRLLLLSGIGKPYDPATGKGVVGRNYAYQTIGGVTAFFDESVNINPFMSSGASLSAVSDYVSDTYDHGPLGFVGGSLIASGISHGRPIDYHPTPPGTPRWGKAWKDAVMAHYNHTLNISVSGSSMPSRHNYLDLDPTYKDAWGMPLLRMTFDFPANDVRMSAFCTGKAQQLAQHVGARQVSAAPRTGPYDVTVYQSTHNVGGAVMGDDPSTSVVNRYQQVWDVPNVFVVGASSFPHNAAYNPTGTVGALAYYAADAIIHQYRAAPGALLHV